jgi:FAD/FMN-containing dehydrogenase/Fe-S oxidoreductase
VIPRLNELEPITTTTRSFLDALRSRGFRGELSDDLATRVVGSTDNSIYQILPQAIIYPRDASDVALLMKVRAESQFSSVTLTARGGGTGTNGQSLTSGVIVDVGRHMNRILALDLETHTVEVEPGVVLDQLNAFLEPHGVFFAPNLSPSSRATIGGMIATDACGQGSRVYGKTSQHVVDLDLVLTDGAILRTRPLSRQELETEVSRGGRSGDIHKTVGEVVVQHRDDFIDKLPKLARFLTGYNIARCYSPENDTFDLKWLVTGAEGTLGLVTRARLKLTPIPTARSLAVLEFPTFEAALAGAEALVALNPSSIETIDDKVLNLARQDIIMQEVSAYLPTRSATEPRTAAINLVEFESTSRAEVEELMNGLISACEQNRGKDGWPFAWSVAASENDRKSLWQLRAKGVGLLGNTKGRRKPVPFVEDTVVPPEKLSAYVAEFRAILEAEGLEYGMFGHVDVGCLHVRPALDLRDLEDEKRLRRISDKVANLCQKYGGVIWGEHGKGFRSEYSPLHFGDLFVALEKIKGAFDPDHILNPGKVATPPGKRHELVKIDQPTRGQHDRQIARPSQDDFTLAIDCNGNGQCYHWDPNHVMCPSSKVTRDRIHTPKGRASVMREWLRQLSRAGQTVRKHHYDSGLKSAVMAPVRAVHTVGRALGRFDYNHEVHRAMQGCLACKACATQCPVKVDVPNFRADFLNAYHSRYLRPVRDHLIGGLEGALGLMSKAPRLFNFFLKRRWFQGLMARLTGLVDTPALPDKSLPKLMRERGLGLLEPAVLDTLEPVSDVIILQDAFTTYYEPEVLLATRDLLASLGLRPHIAPFFPNGKGLHVKGFLRKFDKRIRKNLETLRRLAKSGAPLVTIEPAVGLTYRDEYRHVLGDEMKDIKVELLQELLVRVLKDRPKVPQPPQAQRFRLLGHCTEKTLAPASQRQWVEVFGKLGLGLELVPTGCCGMSGAFGHERIHREESKGIWDLSWARHFEDEGLRSRLLASGYSCRSQAERFASYSPRHPVLALLEHARAPGTASDPSRPRA